jgi:hypothetical protein
VVALFCRGLLEDVALDITSYGSPLKVVWRSGGVAVLRCWFYVH